LTVEQAEQIKKESAQQIKQAVQTCEKAPDASMTEFENSLFAQ
jgi:TPP-dependent pyruvate/acetoin dehydrogenase alpha subunit